MSIYEYDEERHMRQTRAEGYEDGEAAGMKKGEEIIRRVFVIRFYLITIGVRA